jgi:hypothetical protein
MVLHPLVGRGLHNYNSKTETCRRHTVKWQMIICFNCAIVGLMLYNQFNGRNKENAKEGFLKFTHNLYKKVSFKYFN